MARQNGAGEGGSDDLRLGHSEFRALQSIRAKVLGSHGSPGSATGREAWQDFVSFSFLSRRWASEKVTISLAPLRPLASLTSVPPPRTGPGPVHHVIKTAVFAAGQMWVKRRLFPTQLRQTAVCCKKTKPVADGSRKRCLMRSLGCTQCSTQRLGTPAGPGRGQDAAQQNQSHDQAGELPLEGAVAAPAESGYELLSRPR